MNYFRTEEPKKLLFKQHRKFCEIYSFINFSVKKNTFQVFKTLGMYF